MAQGFIQYILSVLMTFLPPRYRDPNASLRGEAMSAGILQFLAAVGLLVYRFAIFSWARAAPIDPNVVNATTASNVPDANAIFGGGVFMMADFLFNPWNMLLVYLMYEGMVRFLAALVGHQVIGTLPLYVVSGVHGLIDKKSHEQYLGELVVDLVIPGGEKQSYDLKVYSCRPKLNWNPYMTVEYEGKFYQYFKEEHGAAPRRFIYYLRKNPTGRVVVVIDHYKPDAVLKPPADKWAGTPTLWEKVFPNRNRSPLAPDEVVRGGTSRHDYDLKIYSCRPKRDWSKHITIEFEDQWYQLFKHERGAQPRPYIYYLRKAAETHPAVVIRHYKVDDVLQDQ
jgi:hypothetical protein